MLKPAPTTEGSGKKPGSFQKPPIEVGNDDEGGNAGIGDHGEIPSLVRSGVARVPGDGL